MKKLLYLVWIIPMLALAESGTKNTQNNGTTGLQLIYSGDASGQTNTTTTVNQNQASSVRSYYPPSMGAPMLTSSPGNDICLGSISGAVSGMGFGFSGGSTVVDANCVLLKNSARLNAMGMDKAAAIMFAKKLDNPLDAIAMGEPAVYLDMITRETQYLEAKIEALQSFGKSTYPLEDELEDLRIKLKTAQIRNERK